MTRSTTGMMSTAAVGPPARETHVELSHTEEILFIWQTMFNFLIWVFQAKQSAPEMERR